MGLRETSLCGELQLIYSGDPQTLLDGTEHTTFSVFLSKIDVSCTRQLFIKKAGEGRLTSDR